MVQGMASTDTPPWIEYPVVSESVHLIAAQGACHCPMIHLTPDDIPDW